MYSHATHKLHEAIATKKKIFVRNLFYKYRKLYVC